MAPASTEPSAAAAGPAAAEPAARTPVRPGRRPLVVVGVAALSFLGCLDLTVVNTAAPAIARDLGSTLAQTQLVVNVFVVALAMFMVTAGRLSDLLGRRRVLYAGAVAFALASAGAGAAGATGSAGVAVLIGFRFAQGLACAVLYTSCTTVVADAFPPAQRGRAVGAVFAVNGLGLALGPLLGGLLVSAFGWPWIFWVDVPLVAAALVVCGVSVPRSAPAPGARLDLPGTALLAVGLAGVVAAATFGTGTGRGGLPPFVPVAAVAGVLALVAFPLVELRRRDPLVPVRLLADRLFLSAVVADTGLAVFYTTALFLMPLYLVRAAGLSAAAAGVALLPATGTVAVLSPVAGRLVERVGPRPLLLAGFVAFAASGVVQSRLGAHPAWPALVTAFVLMGTGWAGVLGPAAVAALSAVPARLSGLAVGATWTFHNVGGALGLAAGLTVFRLGAAVPVEDVQALPLPVFVRGYAAAATLLAGTSLLALLAIAVLGRGLTASRPGPRRERGTAARRTRPPARPRRPRPGPR